MPNVAPLRGTWLVLDLWAGVSGLCVALLGLGVSFFALGAEQDEQARKCASRIVHVNQVEDERDNFRFMIGKAIDFFESKRRGVYELVRNTCI